MQPNVILFCADQLRYDALRCVGNESIRTPNLDRVAANGVRFTRHITPCQICAPSRATMLTGRYPRHHGVVRNGIALDPSVATLPEHLRQTGYRTHAVGKLHLQPLMAARDRMMPESIAFWDSQNACNWQGPYYGFETTSLVLGEAHECIRAGHYANWLRQHHPEALRLYDRGASRGGTCADLWEIWQSAVPADVHYNTWIADEALRFIDSCDASQPFFMKVSFPDPHHPFSPPLPYSERYNPAAVPRPRRVGGELANMPDYVRREVDPGISPFSYRPDETPSEQGVMTVTDSISEATMGQVIAYTYGLVEMIDHCIGRVLERLDENTVVLFTSDHGELLGDHGLLRKGPSPYRQLIQVPLLASGPSIPGGRTVDSLTSHIDLFATIADLTGSAPPETDGISLAPLLCGEDELDRDFLLAEYHPRVHPGVYNQTILTRSQRFTRYPNQPAWGEWFDLERDPHEHHNLFVSGHPSGAAIPLSEKLSALFPSAPDAGGEVLGPY